jgi:hypothetical protein
MLQIFGVISKTAQLYVENSAQTTSRFSPISYCTPRMKPTTQLEDQQDELESCITLSNILEHA